MADDDGLVREVNEDLRKENMQKLWRNFGRYIVGFSILIVLGTAAIVGLQTYQESKRASWSSELIAAKQQIEDGEYENAETVLTDLINNADGNFSMLASLWLVEMKISQGDNETAKEHIANNDFSGDNSLYTKINSLLLAIVDTGSISSDAGAEQPFALLKKEIKLSGLLSSGKKDEAKKILKSIADNALTPNEMKSRANLLLGQL